MVIQTYCYASSLVYLDRKVARNPQRLHTIKLNVYGQQKKHMNKKEFKLKLSNIKTAISITGKKYRSIQVYGDSIEFVRESKNQTESISVTELFELFTKENLINTSIAKSYISGRVQSPAVAILNELKSNETNLITIDNDSDFQNEPIIENKKNLMGKLRMKPDFLLHYQNYSV